ncbi:MAG: 3-deoxy-D-manno-octulosonic acid transferase [Blastocatellia bacterium AA13]|nr:MAG: 3-deoxy-D-manno-octulosonic acid transferase [Blastocatellia bacterium AA13]
MYLLYSLAYSLAFLFLLPYFIFQSLKNGKYLESFSQRMGFLPRISADDDGPSIWVHAVSVGEFLAAQPLIAKIRLTLPGFKIVVSTTTITAQRLARERSPSSDSIFYFPFDWQLSARRSLEKLRPSCVVIMETELWPNFLRQCRLRNVPVVIANGRISDRSYSGYRRAGRFIKRVLGDVHLFLMQTETDAGRAEALGAPPERVRVCGNVKFDQSVPSRHSSDRAGFARLIALSEGGPLIVAGSTAPREEAMLLDAFRKARRRPGLAEARLLIAPRHPERFEEVAELITRSEFTLARRSSFSDESASRIEPVKAEVLLLDSIGELSSAYVNANVVFVGGSLVPRGGHNVIEPAALARPVITGPYTENFREIIKLFVQADALIQLEEESESGLSESLANRIVQLVEDSAAASAMGQRARALVERNSGAVDCILSELNALVVSGTGRFLADTEMIPK